MDTGAPDYLTYELRKRLMVGLRGEGAHLTLDEAVDDFPDALINEFPPNVTYSFWHMLEHIRVVQWDLLMYATEPSHVSPKWPDEIFPDVSVTANRAQWEESVKAIRNDRDRLISIVSDSACDLLKPRDYMDGRSIYRAVLLAIDHQSYHIGEIVMARQILGYWRSELTDYK
ncbi:MAG: DinB family protein [Desulfobacteraceae bacterium]|nr:DinB family protein [Desulfobacteraceae bacterium]